MTYFKPLAKWAARRGLMNGGFGELERPAQAAKKQLVLSQRRRRAPAFARRIIPRYRRPGDASDRRALQRGV